MSRDDQGSQGQGVCFGTIVEMTRASDKPAPRNNSENSPTAPAKPSPTEPRPNSAPDQQPNATEPAREIGGQKGPEPTRYGDWEKNGRCTDF